MDDQAETVSSVNDPPFRGKRTPTLEALVERDGAECRWCGATSDLTVDHVIPKSNGGENTLENMQLLCGSCNSEKGKRDEAQANKSVRFASSLMQAGFTQVPNVVLLDTNLSTGARFAYIGLCFFARQDEEAFPGQEKFAEKMGLSERAFRNARKELEEAKLLRRRRRGRGQTNVYILLDLRNPRPAEIDTSSPAESAALDRHNLPESKKTQEKKTQSNKTACSADVKKVWDHFIAVFKPARTTPLGPSRIRQIETALKEYPAADLCLAIDGLYEWRKRKPGDRSLSAIFKTYPGGNPLADQIEFFIKQAKGSTGVGGNFPSADRAIVTEKQRLVQRGHRLAENPEAVEQAKDAEQWLREHGIETVTPDGPGVPTFRPLSQKDAEAA